MARSSLAAAILALSFAALSCGGMKGEFGFKRFGEDAYRRAVEVPEFLSDEEIAWVYRFRKKYGERDIGVICQKKELVWVEVFSKVDRIDNTRRNIYGDIRGLEPGEYRIVLTELRRDNRLIDSADFIIYERAEEE